jgi:hypothetical protein
MWILDHESADSQYWQQLTVVSDGGPRAAWVAVELTEAGVSWVEVNAIYETVLQVCCAPPRLA